MIETGDIRRRLKRVVEQSQRAAQERRARADVASQQGEQTLRRVVAPMFRAMAGVLKAEGYLFKVSTPKGSVQLAAEGPGENFIEVTLNTSDDPPALYGRVSRSRGRRVHVDERVVREGDAIGTMTDEEVIDYLLGELPPFVEK